MKIDARQVMKSLKHLMREAENNEPQASGDPRFHPAGLAFPEMSAEELRELADDIKQNGLAHPIVIDGEGLILDGRNRLKACEIAGVEPRFEKYKGDDPFGYIVSANLKRRHLNESQRALIAARLSVLAAKRAANRGPSGKFAARLDGVKQAAAAALLNVSQRSVRDAGIVGASGHNDIIRAVEQGDLAVSTAAKQVRKMAESPATPPPPPIDIAPWRQRFRSIERAASDGDREVLDDEMRHLLNALRQHFGETK